ncbi:monocarboxylate transporter 7-like [Eucyclogobius newberryi]|uniref:monocarboxylate transporter 7-like n=1 Tax=Eucyclogobius newberryi TaxID=166745 RepID=UPI003B5A1380
MAGFKMSSVRFLGPNVYPAAPDGGWGWVVAVAFFVVEAFTYGTIKIFGIFLLDLIEEFNETNSRVSWIVSICVFVMTFNGPLSSMMTTRFGFQPVVMLGGLLISSGTIATSFTTSINQMYLTYGLISGFGYCLTFLPTVTILSQYFSHKRSLVTAIASTGESLSMFALAPAFSALRDKIGWRHTMAVIGALQSTIIICGAMLRTIIIDPKVKKETKNSPNESNEEDSVRTEHCQNKLNGDSGNQSPKDTNINNHEAKTLLEKSIENKCVQNCEETQNGDIEVQTPPKSESLAAKKPKLLDFSILKEPSFIFYSLFGLFATLGFFAPPLYIIELSVSWGVERDRAIYMLPIMAVAEILGRFSVGWVMTRTCVLKRKLLVLLACIVIMSADLVGFTLVSEFYGLAVCSALYGFFMGTVSCTHIPLLAEDDVVGIERMSAAAGVYVFIHSFAGLAGPPLGGVLVDVTKNYGAAFYSCAAGMTLSAVFLALVRPAKRGLICKRNSTDSGQQKEKYLKGACTDNVSQENVALDQTRGEEAPQNELNV